MERKKFLILDANSIINRAFYGIRLLSTKEGIYTNGIYGFLNILFKYIDEISPQYIAAAFDLKAPTFRHKMYDEYKATRKPMPEELRGQIPLLKEILELMNIPVLQKEGFEADDIIGTVSKMCTESYVDCLILTGDKDDLQLATENNRIYLVTTKMGSTETEIFDDKKVFEKYGVTPDEFIDVKAIMGDASDNIPGIKGIGEKGALSLISQFKSLDVIYENLESEKITKSVREKLKDGKESAYLSKKLATIDKNIPLAFSIKDAAKKEYKTQELAKMFKKLEFKSFLKKLDIKEVEESSVSVEYKKITKEEFKALTNEKKSVSFLIDKSCNVLYFAFSESICYSIEINNDTKALLKAFFENKIVNFTTHNLKEAIIYLLGYDINIEGKCFDTMIAAYLIDPARHDYDFAELCYNFLSVTISKEAQGGAVQLVIGEEETNLHTHTAMLMPLRKYEEEKLNETEQMKLFSEIEMPLVFVLASMQQRGVLIDREKLESFGKMLSEKINVLVKEIYELAGREFNINSPKQLGEVLYKDLELVATKKTKTGYSTNAETLEKLIGFHPIIEKILEYRQLAKLNSTYVLGLCDAINKETKRIHSNFNQTVTVTGRISSTEPNLQNIPVRTELGREMRKMFVAEEGFSFVGADYSQIELRVLAHIAKDENMISAFKSGEDIHAATACRIFSVEKDEITTAMRTAAKAINFGLIYGKGEFSLAKDLNISMKEAKNYISDYLGTYLDVQQYMKDVVSNAHNDGYVKTMFGRRREISELFSKNYQLRSFGERAALNTPIQGSAADIIKLAMVRVYERLKENNLKSRLVLQVHDELIVETADDEIEIVKKILKEQMEKATKLLVPLKVDMNVGKSWYDTK